MSKIEKEIRDYKSWCVAHGHRACEFKNLNAYVKEKKGGKK